MKSGINGHQKDEILRMVVVMRGDIQMSPGKAMAQAGHAYKLLTKKLIEEYPELKEEYFGPNGDDIGTNITLKTDTIEEFTHAYSECIGSKCPLVIVEDSGHIHPPDFDGSPIVTAFGIGPIRKSETPEAINLLKTYR